MRAEQVVILGGRTNIVSAARELGLDVLWIIGVDAKLPADLSPEVRVLRADFADPDALLALVGEVHERRPVSRVFSLTESGLVATGLLNERLGLGGNSSAVVRTLLDKSIMRDVLARAGLPAVAHRLVHSLDETLAFLTDLGRPIILKPPADAGSRHVFPVANGTAAETAWKALAGAGITTMLAEELLLGWEISVESLSCDGEHYPIGFTDKAFVGDTLIEAGHTMPAAIDEPTRRVAAAAVGDFLDAVGLIEGPTHTELMLTPAGPRIIESHTRVGGGGIPAVVELAYGVDLPRLTVAVPLGLAAPPRALPEPIGGAASRAILPAPGRVTGIAVPGELPGGVRVSVECSVGDVIGPLRSAHDKKAGLVVAAGPDAATAAARCERVRDAIRVTTVP